MAPSVSVLMGYDCIIIFQLLFPFDRLKMKRCEDQMYKALNLLTNILFPRNIIVAFKK